MATINPDYLPLSTARPLPFRCGGRGTRYGREADVYLRKVTLILMISMVASFSIRTLGTISPQLFTTSRIIKATGLMNAFFVLSHLLFWLVFYKHYISIEKATLKKKCLLAIIGSFSVATIYLKNLLPVFGINIHFPQVLMNPYVDALVPLMGSAFHLIFFAAYRTSLARRKRCAQQTRIIDHYWDYHFHRSAFDRPAQFYSDRSVSMA